MKCRGFIIYSALCILVLLIACAEDNKAPKKSSSSASLPEDNKAPKFAIGDDLQDMIIAQPDEHKELICYINTMTDKKACLESDELDTLWETYSDTSIWQFVGRQDSLVKAGTPARLVLPLVDEFGLNRVVEHFHSNLLTCIIVAPRFSLQDEGYWAIMEKFHQWSKKNNVQVVAYVNDQENDPFDMKGALGLTLQVNATHRKYIYPLIENDLGMIVMYKGVILDKINLEDFPNDLPSLIKKVPQWKEKSIKK